MKEKGRALELIERGDNYIVKLSWAQRKNGRKIDYQISMDIFLVSLDSSKA